MTYKQAKEYTRYWHESAYKFKFVQPSYIVEAFAALDYYETHQDSMPVIIVQPPAPEVPKNRSEYSLTRQRTSKVCGQKEINFLRQHPEMTLRQMAEAVGVCYSYMSEIARNSKIKYQSRYKKVA